MRKTLALLAAVVCLLAIGPSASSWKQTRFSPVDENGGEPVQFQELVIPSFGPLQSRELVIGSFSCSASPGCCVPPLSGQVRMSFNGTAGITTDQLGVARSFQGVVGEPLEICEALTGTPFAVAQEFCTVSEIGTSTFNTGSGTGVNMSFSFVCNGPRNEVVNAIGEMSEALVLGGG